MIKLNGHDIDVTIFPDGTSQVWHIPEEVFSRRSHLEQMIEWTFQSEAELFHLFQLCDLLNAKGLEVGVLDIPYLPYARQDKEVSNNSTFAKHTFTAMLKNLPCVVKSISCLDAHSKVFNGEIFSHQGFNHIGTVIELIKPDLICYPDKGAKQRYDPAFLKRYTMRHRAEFISFTKVRDQQTGYIKNLFLNEDITVANKTVLIVDDICDGGMTFILSAKKLIEMGAGEVVLYTTHGIYSKGVKVLLDSGISRVYNHKGQVFPSKQSNFLLKENE